MLKYLTVDKTFLLTQDNKMKTYKQFITEQGLFSKMIAKALGAFVKKKIKSISKDKPKQDNVISSLLPAAKKERKKTVFKPETIAKRIQVAKRKEEVSANDKNMKNHANIYGRHDGTPEQQRIFNDNLAYDADPIAFSKLPVEPGDHTIKPRAKKRSGDWRFVNPDVKHVSKIRNEPDDYVEKKK